MSELEEQAKNMLFNLIDNLKLTKGDRDTLYKAVNILSNGTQPVDPEVKED